MYPHVHSTIRKIDGNLMTTDEKVYPCPPNRNMWENVSDEKISILMLILITDYILHILKSPMIETNIALVVLHLYFALEINLQNTAVEISWYDSRSEVLMVTGSSANL